MRIRELKLIRYGKFTDRSLALPLSDRDIHLIVGPNEAGKSTVRTAIGDWLFGIPMRTPLAFLHPMPELRVGGIVERLPYGETVGQQLAFHRTKGNRTRCARQRMQACQKQRFSRGSEAWRRRHSTGCTRWITQPWSKVVQASCRHPTTSVVCCFSRLLASSTLAMRSRSSKSKQMRCGHPGSPVHASTTRLWMLTKQPMPSSSKRRSAPRIGRRNTMRW
ncbi:MAG: AAA family ATPase [Betaproteobacteria bacterium]|nr:AAA family ATPase [Betaproteobacteria bacterium]